MKKAANVALSAALAVAFMPSAAAITSGTQQTGGDGAPVAEAATASSMTVQATKTQIKVNLKGIGTSGTATVYKMKANEYAAGDTLTGLDKAGAAGTAIGAYNCGTTATITADRYDADGYDSLYDKYYVIQDGKILRGPVYATTIASNSTKALAFKTSSKKGYAEEVTTNSTYTTAKAVAAKNAVVTIDISKWVLPNEDANGNPISYAGRSDVDSIVSNGKTYYFNKSKVSAEDSLIKKFTKAKMNVTAAVWAYTTNDWSSYPKALTYDVNKRVTMGYNTGNALGRDYFIATMEFLAQRYSKSDQRIKTFIVGNETDLAHDWSAISDGNKAADINVYMEEYSRGLRLANLAVKKYSSNMQVAMATSNSWATNRYNGMGGSKFYGSSKAYVANSYAPKKLYDWLSTHEKARGDYNWALAPHAYDISTTNAEYLKNDFKRRKGGLYKTVTASYENSPWITTANLEIIQQYLNRSSMKYNGKIRDVYLTESAISSVSNSNKTFLGRQAATLAQYYYRAASLPCVQQIAYYAYTTKDGTLDASTKLFGLYTKSGKKKPTYNLWKKIDTKSGFKLSKSYLKYLKYYDRKGKYFTTGNKRIKSYYDVMFADNPSYNYKKAWPFKKYIKPVRGKK